MSRWVATVVDILCVQPQIVVSLRVAAAEWNAAAVLMLMCERLGDPRRFA